MPFFVGFALECYVCLGQRTNKDKCIKTTIQCEQEQDACKTQIRWQRKLFFYLYTPGIIMPSYQPLSLFLEEFLIKISAVMISYINLFIKGEIR